MSNLELVEVTRPDTAALATAIACFEEDGVERGVDESLSAMVAIIGESRALLDEGKTVDEVVASLGERGLSEGCARPFVEKANDSLLQVNLDDAHAPPAQQRWGLAILTTLAASVVCGVLIYFLKR